MSHDLIQNLPPAEWCSEEVLRSGWEPCPHEEREQSAGESQQLAREATPNQPFGVLTPTPADECRCELVEKIEGGPVITARSICQEPFFFCTVKKIGDLPGAGCIYVETAVDCGSGRAFAKLYPAKNAMNAVDMLRGRVVPFFERRGETIKEVHTRKTTEYCGTIPFHPFETFLATSHIRHLHMDGVCLSCRHRCEQFYRLLLKEFFMPTLRKRFEVTLDQLQLELDAFVDAHNAARGSQKEDPSDLVQLPTNFPVHP